MSKILTIARLSNSLGGASKALQLFWGTSCKWKTIQALGGAAAALGAELLATLWFAVSGPGIVGSIATDLRGVHVDPCDVRRDREDHPGASIGEGTSAVARR